jgi:hypothetical protein
MALSFLYTVIKTVSDNFYNGGACYSYFDSCSIIKKEAADCMSTSDLKLTVEQCGRNVVYYRMLILATMFATSCNCCSLNYCVYTVHFSYKHAYLLGKDTTAVLLARLNAHARSLPLREVTADLVI